MRGFGKGKRQGKSPEEITRRPVSRVLSLPFGRGRPFLWDAPCGAPHATYPGGGPEKPWQPPPGLHQAGRRPPLFGLAPGGVCPAAPVARGAVRSYRAISPLPAGNWCPCAGGVFSVALSLGSPPPAVSRHRLSVEPGLSSSDAARATPPAVARPSGWVSDAGGDPRCQAAGGGQLIFRSLRRTRRSFGIGSSGKYCGHWVCETSPI